jgi:transposase-like protein
MKKPEKKYYSKEYKLKAVVLSEKRETISLVAEELGIRHDMLRIWRQEH